MKKISFLLMVAALLGEVGPISAQTSDAGLEPLWVRHVNISPDGKNIAFSYLGDIYTVPSEGGQAVRITSNPAYDSRPVWSPDGNKIAFVSDREKSLDVFIVDAKGGMPTRLTTRTGAEEPLAFTNHGTILYTSSVMPTAQSTIFPSGTFFQVYEISVNGGRPTLFSAHPMMQVSLNPNGSLLYEDVKGGEDGWRKHHTSSVTRDIWLLENGKHTKLTTFKGEDLNPVWAPDYKSFYYLSQENGTLNIYNKGIGPDAKPVQITHFETHPVRFLSVASNGLICFTYNGELYTMKQGEEPRKVEIHVLADNQLDEMSKTIMRSGASEIAVNPKQEEVAFVLGGDVYVTSVEYATTKRITNTPATERNVTFSPDGRSLAYDSERDGVWQVYQTSLVKEDEKMFTYATGLKEENLTKQDVPCFQSQYSPDGKSLAFLKNRTELCVLDLKKGKVVTAMDGKYEYSYIDGDQSYTWSPDSRWLMTGYIGVGGWHHHDIALVKADGSGEIHNLTNSGYSEEGGRFVLGGKAMLFASDRKGYRSHGSWGSETDIFLTFFDKEAYEKFLMDKEEKALSEKREEAAKSKSEKKKEEKEAKKDSADEKKKVEELKFDFDYLEDRTICLTNASDHYADMVLSPDGKKLYYIAPNHEKWALWCKDLEDESITMKVANVGRGSLIMDESGANIYILSLGSIKKIATATGSSEVIEYEALYENDKVDQRAYLLDHMWRGIKDKFYDPTIRNMDWDSMYRNYKRFLPHINNGYDFSEMGSELLGELNASHTGCFFFGGPRATLSTAALGAFLDENYDGDGLKFIEILHNSPFALAGKEIKAGDVITHIDGQPIKAGKDYFPMLEGKAGQSTRFTIKPVKGKSFDVYVKPITAGEQNELLYERWVRRNTEMVDSLSNGRIAYVHIQGMDSESFRDMYRKVLNATNRVREAVIIDTRNNGGGWLHDDVATLFSGKLYARFSPRGQYVSDEPYSKWTKPSCMLVSENNYSDAHGTPWVYQQLKIGKLIGAPVPGTMTAVWWEYLPGGYVYGIPQVGVLDSEDKYLENQDLIPDVIIYNTPESVMQGKDLQIEKAVEEMLKEADAVKAKASK